jgi:hypothetical protein
MDFASRMSVDKKWLVRVLLWGVQKTGGGV